MGLTAVPLPVKRMSASAQIPSCITIVSPGCAAAVAALMPATDETANSAAADSKHTDNATARRRSGTLGSRTRMQICEICVPVVARWLFSKIVMRWRYMNLERNHKLGHTSRDRYVLKRDGPVAIRRVVA